MNEFLIRELDYELMRMPYWIDTKSPREYVIWKKIYKCNRVLASLFTHEILTDEEVHFLIYQFHINFERITDKTYELDIAAYYSNLLHKIMCIVLDEEEYATAANLKKMCDMYLNGITSYLDEKNKN